MKYGCPNCNGHVEIEEYNDSSIGCPHCGMQVIFTPMHVPTPPPLVPVPQLAAPNAAELAAGQPVEEVTSAMRHLEQYCTQGEIVAGIALQNRIMTAGMTPDLIACTGRRIILLVRGVFGCKMMDALWIDVCDVRIEEGIIGASIRVSLVNGTAYIIEKLHKPAARAFYRLCQAREEEMRVARNAHLLQRAAAGAARINVNVDRR